MNMMGSVNVTPSKNRDVSNPQTPKRASSSRFPLSSPYSGKSPLPMPILLPSQYNMRSSDTPLSEGIVDSELRSEKSVHNDSQNINEDGVTGRIELFDKLSVKQQTNIPSLGCSLEEMPFFDKERSTRFVDSLNGISKQMSLLKKANDTIVDFNESLGAYMFGLFQNAWCVNFNENVNSETVEKINQINKLKSDLAKLQNELEISKRNSVAAIQEQKRKNNIIRKFSNATDRKDSFARPKLIPKRKISYSNVDKGTTSKRTFLKAGSRHQTFRSRSNVFPQRLGFNENYRNNNNNNNNYNNNNGSVGKPLHSGNGLKLSYATKIQTTPSIADDSITDSSGSDTSEVQTLTGITGVRNRPLLQPRFKTPVIRPTRPKPSWEAKHRRPFR